MNILSMARTALPARHRSAGFTLMEIMVVVIIVSILTGIGLPLYQDAVRKGRRADAKQTLMDPASRLEKYLLDRNTYTADMKALGYKDINPDPGPDDPDLGDRISNEGLLISEERYYEIERVALGDCAIDTRTCYVLRATPRADSPQNEDERCTSFTLESTGAQTAEGTDKENCW
jgi:type IV pilus assembly protein PilE